MECWDAAVLLFAGFPVRFPILDPQSEVLAGERREHVVGPPSALHHHLN
jgi:hypothetical protein